MVACVDNVPQLIDNYCATETVCMAKVIYNAHHHNNFEFTFYLATLLVCKSFFRTFRSILISHSRNLRVSSCQISEVSGSKHVDRSSIVQ